MEPTLAAPSPRRRPGFAFVALACGIGLALAAHAPVLRGRVPFPADVVLAFPPWTPLPGEEAHAPRHAELGDLATQVYPWRLFAQRTLQEGRLPLWNPHLLLGTPHLANGQSALFWPVHWLDRALPLPLSWTLGILLEIAFTFFSTALLARELGCRTSGAFLAGVAFTLSGFLVAWGLWPLADGARCLPLVLYAVLRLDRRPGVRTVALAGVAFALPVVAGHPQMAFYDFAAAAAFATYLAARSGAPRMSRVGRRLAAALTASALAAGLTAAQWLPTWEWIGRLVRPLGGEGWAALPPRHLVAWLSRDLGANPNALGIAVPEEAAYLGVTTLLLVPLALARRGRRSAGFWVGLAIVAAGIAYGVPPVATLARALPLVGGLSNHRLLLYLELALALLAGLGLTALVERDGQASGRRLCWAAGIALAGGLVALSWATARADAQALAGAKGLATSWALWVASALAIAGSLLPRRRPSPAVGWALTALLAGDLAHVAAGHVPAVEAARIFPPAPVFDLLRERSERHAEAGQRVRVGFLGMVAPANSGLVYQLDTVEGYDYVSRRAAALLAPLTGAAGWNDYHQLLPAAAARGPLLDLLAVRYLVAANGSEAHAVLARDRRRYRRLWAGGRLVVYENPDALPGAVLVPWSGIRVEPNAEATLRALAAPDFDPRRTVLASAAPARPAGRNREPMKMQGTPRLAVERRSGGYRVQLTSPSRAILVLAEQAYPGWRVAVDGEERPLLVVDHALQGVAVPRGEHTVDFTFDPPRVRWGLRISAATAVACLALALLCRRQRWRSIGTVRDARAGDDARLG